MEKMAADYPDDDEAKSFQSLFLLGVSQGLHQLGLAVGSGREKVNQALEKAAFVCGRSRPSMGRPTRVRF